MKKNYLLFICSILLIFIFAGAQCTGGGGEDEIDEAEVEEGEEQEEEEESDENEEEEVSDVNEGDDSEIVVDPHQQYLGDWLVQIEKDDIWMFVEVYLNEGSYNEKGFYEGKADSIKSHVYSSEGPPGHVELSEEFATYTMILNDNSGLKTLVFTPTNESSSAAGFIEDAPNGEIFASGAYYLENEGHIGYWYASKGNTDEEYIAWLDFYFDTPGTWEEHYGEDFIEDIDVITDIDEILIADAEYLDEDGIVIEDAVE